MTFMESIDHTISGPARKLSDFAHRRKPGADVKIGGELIVLGNVIVVVAATMLGHYLFAMIAAVFLVAFVMLGGWKGDVQAMRPNDTDLNRFLKLIVLMFGVVTIINGSVQGNLIVTLLGTGFVTQLLGDQMMNHRMRNG